LLERAWVNARIQKLAHQRETLAASDEDLRSALKKEIVDLSTKYRVLSDYTGLVVLETEADYARFHIDRRSLSDVLVVGSTGIERMTRGRSPPPPAQPALTEQSVTRDKGESGGARRKAPAPALRSMQRLDFDGDGIEGALGRPSDDRASERAQAPAAQ